MDEHESGTQALPLGAARRGEQHLAELHACAPAAFAAVMDRLGDGHDPQFSRHA